MPKNTVGVSIFLFLFSMLCIQCLPFIHNKPVKARSCSQDDVRIAIDRVQDNGTVLLPAGHATWTSTVEVPDNKRITICGAGPDKTVITSDIAGNTLDLNASGSRLTQTGFILKNDTGLGIAVRGEGWRIDHCEFTDNEPYTIEAVWAYNHVGEGHTKGVVDHCRFNSCRVLVYGCLNLMANGIWAEPLGLGTNNAVFVEDCNFNFTKFGNVIDSNYGGRYVFRYNTVIDAYIEAHSVQGANRAARSWEIYHNTISQQSRSMWVPIFLRGGTGVVWNNTITGTWTECSITVDNRRSFEEFPPPIGPADGSSPWDGNEDANGWPARDQIGRSTDEFLWVDSNEDGDYTTGESIPSQASDPMYQWNNLHDGIPIGVYVHNGCGHHIQENRDYYNNTTKPGYTPYTYPYPLIFEWDYLR
ncbi:MAG: hypothetical protein JW904_08775 [Spirochaetales bacterium]|nr:hypothetical protein [Spirochaetales bacterium]